MGTTRPLPQRHSKGKGTEKAYEDACRRLEDQETPTAFLRNFSQTVLVTDRRILVWTGMTKSLTEFPLPPETSIVKTGPMKAEHLVAGKQKVMIALYPADLTLLARALGQPTSTDTDMQLGRVLARERLNTKQVTIYQNGFVKVSGLLSEGSAERLLSISATADITKKTGLGRAAAAVMTGGYNLMASNMRGDAYLVIATDRTTHTLHTEVPDAAFLKKIKALEAAGLAALARQSATGVSGEGAQPTSQKSVPDQIREMKALLDEGVIAQEDFDKFKTGLLG